MNTEFTNSVIKSIERDIAFAKFILNVSDIPESIAKKLREYARKVVDRGSYKLKVLQSDLDGEKLSLQNPENWYCLDNGDRTDLAYFHPIIDKWD